MNARRAGYQPLFPRKRRDRLRRELTRKADKHRRFHDESERPDLE